MATEEERSKAGVMGWVNEANEISERYESMGRTVPPAVPVKSYRNVTERPTGVVSGARPTMHGEVVRLSECVAVLSKRIDELVGRLQPIMRSDVDMTVRSSYEAGDGEPIALSNISELRRRVEQIDDRVGSVLEALCL